MMSPGERHEPTVALMNQLLPEPGTGPSPQPHLTPEQRIEAWIELMKFGDQCFMAGLQRRLRPGQDVRDAVRESYARRIEEPDRKLLRIMRRLEEADGR
jgi:hypothetical protein